MYVDVMFLKHKDRTTPIWIFVDQATLKVIVSSPQSGATRDATTFINALTAVNAYFLKHHHSRVPFVGFSVTARNRY